MLNLNNIRIKPKLISLFLLIGLLPLLSVGWYALQQSEEALLKTSFNHVTHNCLQFETLKRVRSRLTFRHWNKMLLLWIKRSAMF